MASHDIQDQVNTRMRFWQTKHVDETLKWRDFHEYSSYVEIRIMADTEVINDSSRQIGTDSVGASKDLQGGFPTN